LQTAVQEQQTEVAEEQRAKQEAKPEPEQIAKFEQKLQEEIQ